jgi:cell division septum initiation protein DivIVA
MLQIEVGKFYRMRCGGAVRIVEVERNLIYAEFDEMTWFKYGEFALNRKEHPFDLTEEITEAEYNRIIAGDAYTSAILDTAETAIGKMHEDIKALKAENARLTGEVNRLSENTAFDRISEKVRQDNRRFEAAKSAMQGILSNTDFSDLTERQIVDLAIIHANELLETLEEAK